MDSLSLLDRGIVAEKYELVREIGRGASGAVYEARNLATLGRCAVKVLSAHFLNGDQSSIRRFLAEARTASAITSNHVVRVFDCGVDPSTGVPYIAMELLEGEDLAATIHRLGPLDPLAASKIALQAASGLAKAHSLGIVHRDIKPANLFLSRDDSGQLTVKLCDFGIAKLNPELLIQTTLTRSGSLLGTPLYMSPEQARHSPNIDARTDVWSLGIVMYEMLTGEAPYAEPMSLGELMVQLLTSTLPKVEGRARWVSPELAEIVNHALRRDLGERFRDGSAMRDALLRVVTGGSFLKLEDVVAAPNSEPSRISSKDLDQTLPSEGLSSHPSTIKDPEPGPPPSGTRRRTLWALAIAVGTLGAVALVYRWLGRPEGSPLQQLALTTAVVRAGNLPAAILPVSTASEAPPPPPEPTTTASQVVPAAAVSAKTTFRSHPAGASSTARSASAASSATLPAAPRPASSEPELQYEVDKHQYRNSPPPPRN